MICQCLNDSLCIFPFWFPFCSSLQKVVAALHAGAEFAEVPLYRCVLVAGSQSGVAGAQQIGMTCVVLRSR